MLRTTGRLCVLLAALCWAEDAVGQTAEVAFKEFGFSVSVPRHWKRASREEVNFLETTSNALAGNSRVRFAAMYYTGAERPSGAVPSVSIRVRPGRAVTERDLASVTFPQDHPRLREFQERYGVKFDMEEMGWDPEAKVLWMLSVKEFPGIPPEMGLMATVPWQRGTIILGFHSDPSDDFDRARELLLQLRKSLRFDHAGRRN